MDVTGYRKAPDARFPLLHRDYGSTRLRAPRRALTPLVQTLSEATGPLRAHERMGPMHADLTQQGEGEAIGERIIVTGRVLDGDGRPVRRSLVELWQANAAGRYLHARDQHDAPLDPNFRGVGRCLTDEQGRYAFTTIKPGAYPWRNHKNAWRPAHLHFGVFGPCFATRLVTQMYFPGDPLLELDPIYNCVPDAAARQRLIARFDIGTTRPGWALGYRFDIVVGGRGRTPFER